MGQAIMTMPTMRNCSTMMNQWRHNRGDRGYGGGGGGGGGGGVTMVNPHFVQIQLFIA